MYIDVYMMFSFLLQGFLVNKNAFSITKSQCIKSEENKPMDIRGCDGRYPICNENDSETVIKIKKYMKQLELLRQLENENVPTFHKLGRIKEYEKTFGECKMANNISAGGLWADFYSDIQV